MSTPAGLKIVVLLIPAFIAGALSFYAIQLHGKNTRLAEQLNSLQTVQLQLTAQQALNVRQREEFEGRIQQLQNNLLGAQAQMSNLASALQAARELITPTLPGNAPPADNR